VAHIMGNTTNTQAPAPQQRWRDARGVAGRLVAQVGRGGPSPRDHGPHGGPQADDDECAPGHRRQENHDLPRAAGAGAGRGEEEVRKVRWKREPRAELVSRGWPPWRRAG
jgi:hypothetical protein